MSYESYKEQSNLKSEILEPLHEVAIELADAEEDGKAGLIEFTRLDVIAATVVFTHVLGNKKTHQYLSPENTKTASMVSIEMKEYGERISQLVLDMAGTDINGRPTL